MKRFMGMMPVNKIKIEKIYRDDLGFEITVQAGEHGWTILFADYSSIYRDIDDTAENNFEAALAELRTHIRSFKEEGRMKGDEEE